MRILVDECLSVELVDTAHQAGFEAYHVAHRGWSGLTDSQIVENLVEHELVLVTNNRDDFLDLVEGVELHPGLIVIVPNVRRAEQIALFERALEVASALPSMINKVVEVQVDGTVTVHDLPQI